jgi:hypothetical protein
MSRLLLWNFGTYRETHRFKARALGDGFVGTDAMDESPPGGLVKQGGLQVRKTDGASAVSFYGLTPAVWKANVKEFQTWLGKLLAAPLDCVYLTGHHAVDKRSEAVMYWDETSDQVVFMYLGTQKNQLALGVLDTKAKKTANVVPLGTDNFRASCRLVVGFGCNVAAPNQSLGYQSYFSNGSKKPIVLGWATEMAIPKGSSSVNGPFFDHLAAYAKANSKVPAKDRLAWFYDNEPMEVIRAWGRAVFGLRGSSKALWQGARARHWDGTYYGFEEKGGVAEPVKK